MDLGIVLGFEEVFWDLKTEVNNFEKRLVLFKGELIKEKYRGNDLWML